RRERMGGLSQQEGQRPGDVLVINRMAELVEQHAHPPLAPPQVAEHPDVALAIDVGTEGVLILTFTLVEIATREDVVDRKADLPEEVPSHAFGVECPVDGLQIEHTEPGRLLPEK